MSECVLRYLELLPPPTSGVARRKMIEVLFVGSFEFRFMNVRMCASLPGAIAPHLRRCAQKNDKYCLWAVLNLGF